MWELIYSAYVIASIRSNHSFHFFKTHSTWFTLLKDLSLLARTKPDQSCGRTQKKFQAIFSHSYLTSLLPVVFFLPLTSPSTPERISLIHSDSCVKYKYRFSFTSFPMLAAHAVRSTIWKFKSRLTFRKSESDVLHVKFKGPLTLR